MVDMIKLFIVEDQEIFREGLKRILKEESDMSVVAEAHNGNDVLKEISNIDCDVILLDMNIPGRSGVDLISEVKKRKPKLPILVLSIAPEQKYALPAFKAGASGYMCKDSALDELVGAIRKVNNKGRYLSESLAEKLAFGMISDDTTTRHKLTETENGILLLIARGNEIKDIAEDLALSINTVFSHRRKILEKLSLKNNVEITHYAINNNLLD
jgi:DNA-binding NarL/FixJ family response regulator